ncbi:MAG TPA: 23S rRNA (uracil(1939)-C(5))-methyltransferase RlmD [Candidatus Acidoferrales bacterium]|nr:23S rRNA (uracil(1939)-C(5))-methyltransferase RlmD [Candidatus Acidoferrales bacterium]
MLSAEAPKALPCVHFPNCVGCALIGTPYGEQLRIKHERVQAAFAAYGGFAQLEIPSVIGSPHAFGYRNQAKLVARRAPRGLLLGIYRPGSHQVVDIRACPVHHPLINRVLAAVADALEQYDIPIYDERTRSGALRYVVVRVSTWSKSVQVILVTYDRRLPRLRELARRLQRMRGVASVVQNVNPDPGNVILGREFMPLTRETALIERIGFLKLKTHAGAFLQANVAVARKLYEQAVRWAAPSDQDVCAELYCGVGALAFHLATTAKHVAGIEESPIAVADAKENIRLNGFHNVRFYCGDVARMLPEIAERLGRIDIITLNPPRKGADAATRTAIAACAPRRIVYISCEPSTLARDLDWFTGCGYAALKVQPFDLLPQTEHVECVAALDRQAPAAASP